MFYLDDMTTRKIVDCTFFNDELDILEIRLAEHDNFADYFVIVEGNKTFSGKYKPYYFDLSNPRIMAIWMKYKDRIYYHRISEWNSPDSWSMENQSRRATLVGIKSFKERGMINDDDYVLISDVDEIVDHKCLYDPFKILNTNVFQWNFVLSFRYFFFNCRTKAEIWSAPAMTLVKNYNDPQDIRHHGNRNVIEYIENAGWHFSYMGGIDAIVKKLSSTAHREVDTQDFNNKENIERRIANKEDLFNRPGYEFEYLDDNDYPEFVLQNLDRFGKYFAPERK
jgi:beta-1,4-mannosyl-glycoprotein beta-1,4-N-acetylglucosaminyltransferase